MTPWANNPPPGTTPCADAAEGEKIPVLLGQMMREELRLALKARGRGRDEAGARHEDRAFALATALRSLSAL